MASQPSSARLFVALTSVIAYAVSVVQSKRPGTTTTGPKWVS